MLYLNLIWSSYFDYLVYCSDFVMNFAYFFVLVIFLYNLSYMLIVFFLSISGLKILLIKAENAAGPMDIP